MRRRPLSTAMTAAAGKQLRILPIGDRRAARSDPKYRRRGDRSVDLRVGRRVFSLGRSVAAEGLIGFGDCSMTSHFKCPPIRLVVGHD
jgi:hypothetical protein